jgi:hypothetical protein
VPVPVSQVERVHSGFQNSRRREPLEEFVGEPGAMPSIVVGRLAEIRTQFLESNFC